MLKISNISEDLEALQALESSGELNDEQRDHLNLLRAGISSKFYAWQKDGYYYYYHIKTKLGFRRKLQQVQFEKLSADQQGKIVIMKSIKNATGGYIHVDANGEQEWDLYCERKGDFIFVTECPY